MLKKKMFIALIDVFCIFMLFMSNLPPFKLLIQTAVSESDETESMDQVISDTGLLTIDIHTIDGNNPTYKEADPPDGCLGSSIKDNAYVKGYCEITNMDSGGSFASRMKLKVRGNTSARAAGPDGKLPYKLVLKEAVDLFGDGLGDNRFILLSGAGETLNTYLGFLIGQCCGIEWTPKCRYVNLILNDDYRGIYLLVQAPDGVSLSNHVGSDGFMVECDAYWWKENKYIKTNAVSNAMAYVVKYPDEDRITEAQFEEIHRFIDILEREIIDTGKSELIDWETFVAWIMTRDITGEMDAAGSNIYYYIEDFYVKNPAYCKLHMGPLWDFDNSFVQNNSWSEFHYSSTTYFPYLFMNEKFVDQYIERWDVISSSLYAVLTSELQELIIAAGESIDDSRRLDAERWDRPLITLEEEAENKLAWLQARIAWIDEILGAEKTSGYIKNTVYATASDDSKTLDILLCDDGYNSVQFLVWNDDDGQDESIWWEAHLNKSGYWECKVDLSRFYSKGFFVIDAYAQLDYDIFLVSRSFSYVFSDWNG